MKSVSLLFVCLGNICRSPTAEGVFRYHAQKALSETGIDLSIDSAGTAAYHTGSSPDGRAIDAAAKRDIDISGLRARQVNDSDFQTFDYILAMDQANYRDLMRRCPEPEQHKVSLLLSHARDDNGMSVVPTFEVPDPYYGGAQGFEEVLDLVALASHGLIKKLRHAYVD